MFYFHRFTAVQTLLLCPSCFQVCSARFSNWSRLTGCSFVTVLLVRAVAGCTWLPGRYVWLSVWKQILPSSPFVAPSGPEMRPMENIKNTKQQQIFKIWQKEVKGFDHESRIDSHLPTVLLKSKFPLTKLTSGAARPDRRVILTWCFFSSQLSTCFHLVVRSWGAMPDEKVSSFTCTGAAERIKTVYHRHKSAIQATMSDSRLRTAVLN